MRRQLILDAAIQCFVTLGYANTTSDRIARQAGISRGAMVHHFPTKLELVQAAIQHLNRARIDSFARDIAEIGSAADRAERGLDVYWEHLNSPLFVAYQELAVAARTDPELAKVFTPEAERLEEEWYRRVQQVFPEWAEVGPLFDFAMDLTQFLMEGMALNPLTRDGEQRTRRILSYLKARLQEILAEGRTADTASAIQRHHAG